MALAIVQHSGAIHGNSVPGAITLGAPPTAGNLLIALVGCNTNQGLFTPGAGWTQFDQVNDPTTPTPQVVMVALYRYVQMGDGATLPVFFAAGSSSTYWTHEVWEVSGVSGTWDTDFLSSIPQWGALSNAALPQFPIFANGMALSGTASYNGSSNPSVTGSWTLDDANNNNANFGSAAGAHRVIAKGDTIDGTWTQGASGPFGSILVLLTTIQPVGGVYPRHVFRVVHTSGTPGATTVPWVPKVGSLLLAYLEWDHGADTNPTIGVGWTDWVDATITTKSLLGLYRYVQGGDTATLPAIASAGTDFYAITFIELDGGSGTFATDHVSDKAGAQATGATQTTTADTTTANNQFGLLAYGNYNGAGVVSQSGFTNYFNNEFNINYGSWFVAFKFFPAAGSTVQATITPNSTTTAQSYIQSIFNQGTSTGRNTGHNLTLLGVGT